MFMESCALAAEQVSRRLAHRSLVFATNGTIVAALRTCAPGALLAAQSGALVAPAQMLVAERKEVTSGAADTPHAAGSGSGQKRHVPCSAEPKGCVFVRRKRPTAQLVPDLLKKGLRDETEGVRGPTTGKRRCVQGSVWT
jgi:hypothetical protein